LTHQGVEMANDVLTYLENKIRQEVQIATDDVGMGSSKSYDEYRYYCGVIRGLLIAANYVSETKDRLEELDE